ncbi:B3 domain-containing protein At2g31720-like [Dillenia turbinata]|uniref:B3 domain-containing protein At2g31720-like n=1 Tax=Dillenia turbinata TaxID=194707 RepID=A0AAN8WG20_9MAGN
MSSRVIDNGKDPPPDLPIEFRNAIAKFEGTQSALVIKTIFENDIKPNLNQCSILVRQLRAGFLTGEEKRKETGENCLTVVLTQPLLELLNKRVKLKRNGNGCTSYALQTQWGKVVEKNKIKEGDIVQLWAFRTEMRENTLGLALVRDKRAGKNQQESTCTTSGYGDMGSSSSQILSH